MKVHGLELERSLLRILLEKELDEFRAALEDEDPGLSEAEIERYMRAAGKFAAQLTGDTPRTRGRQTRQAESDDPAADVSTDDAPVDQR